MKLCLTHEQRFLRTPDGAIWTYGGGSYREFQRYLGDFEELRILARVRDIPVLGRPAHRVDGDRIRVVALPYYLGPYQFWLRRAAVRQAALAAIGEDCAVLLRLPSAIAGVLEPELRKRGQPYGTEVAGDPFDLYSRHAARHPLRLLFRWWFYRQVRRACLRGCAVLYVTDKALQVRYPAAPGVFTMGCTDVLLTQYRTNFTPAAIQEEVHLVTVATLEQPYKGIDVLLEAMAIGARQGLKASLVVVGDGRFRRQLESRAAHLGVRQSVRFAGWLPEGDAVVAELDQADIFVLPSRQDTKPRALFEAMAHGLPCIATSVGGIPEMLAAEDMVAPNDAGSLARKIQQVVASEVRRQEMSERNVARARQFRADTVAERRGQFMRTLEEATRKRQLKPLPQSPLVVTHD